MAASETEDSDILWCINHDSFPFKKPLMETQVSIREMGPISSICSWCWIHFSSVLLQMMSNVDGHSWALCAVNDERPAKIFTPLNKELIPITDSPVVVQQHNIPLQKFVLLSAKVNIAISRFIPVCHDQLWWGLSTCSLLSCRGVISFKNFGQ